jgi:hypothetical protein
MEKRHDDLLTARMEEVANRGWAFIAWWEAYLWANQQKLGKNFWRDLKARFEAVADSELYIYEDDAGFLLIEGGRLKLVSSKIGADE